MCGLSKKELSFSLDSQLNFPISICNISWNWQSYPFCSNFYLYLCVPSLVFLIFLQSLFFWNVLFRLFFSPTFLVIFFLATFVICLSIKCLANILNLMVSVYLVLYLLYNFSLTKSLQNAITFNSTPMCQISSQHFELFVSPFHLLFQFSLSKIPQNDFTAMC